MHEQSTPTSPNLLGAPQGAASFDLEYWHALINEREAARFLRFSARHVQGLRYRGGGPRFLRMSARCVRYRRADLRAWADSLARTSTSDPGAEK